jgi:hypothetical protein
MAANTSRTSVRSRLGHWWALGLRGLASLAATEAGMEPQYRVWLHRGATSEPDLRITLTQALPDGEQQLVEALLHRLQQQEQVILWTGPRLDAEVLAAQLRAAGCRVTVAYQLSRWE